MDNKNYKNMIKFFELKQKEHEFLSLIDDVELIKKIYDIKMSESDKLLSLYNLPIGERGIFE